MGFKGNLGYVVTQKCYTRLWDCRSQAGGFSPAPVLTQGMDKMKSEKEENKVGLSSMSDSLHNVSKILNPTPQTNLYMRCEERTLELVRLTRENQKTKGRLFQTQDLGNGTI